MFIKHCPFAKVFINLAQVLPILKAKQITGGYMTSLLNNVNSLVKSTFFTLKQLKENTVLKETASKDYFSRQISN